jgi:hypothetical protein
MSQIPHGPNDKYCPMWRKPQSKVCHTCPWWTKVTGTNPNSKNAQAPEMIDRWDCAIAWAPVLAVHASRETFSVAAQVQEMRNETAKNNTQTQDNLAALSQNLITMHGQNTQLALMQVQARALTPPTRNDDEPQLPFLEHQGNA